MKTKLKSLAKRALAKSRRIAAYRPRWPEPHINYEVDVSVVMPVYNCEEHLEQAIRSITANTKCTFEIIAINDESPDDVWPILIKLAAEIPQLNIFNQKNIGGAKTLNRGLKMAKGKYVTFLDCDDWLLPAALDILFTKAEANQSDVTSGVVQKYSNGSMGILHDFRHQLTEQIIKPSQKIPREIFFDSFYTGKLFRRRLLEEHQITFNPNLLYADRPFVSKAIVYSDTVTLIPTITAVWRKHPDGRSVTDGFHNPNNLIDKAIGFWQLLTDPRVSENPHIHKSIFLEASERIFWNYENAADPIFAQTFAFATRSLLAGYPDFDNLTAPQVSLRRKLIFRQIANYLDTDFHEYRQNLERLISANSQSSVKILASKMNAMPHIGAPQKTLPPFPTSQNPNLFVFESFFGKSFGGNPRYLYEELIRSGRKFTAVWVYSPKRRPFKLAKHENVNIIQVKRGSALYFQHLREAKYWVNNIRFPDIVKPQGTIYIQTWHGTPLKRLGLDIEAKGPEVEARKSFLKDAAQWDYLLAQNEYSGEIFKRAFDVSCPVLIHGYPANDLLVDPKQTASISTFIRQKYRIPADKKIITYAPTWRDTNQVGNKWEFNNPINLDFHKLKQRIGDEYVVVVRLHHLMVKNLDPTGLEGFLFDASNEPDANRLMAATDILVTDYSSIFFDYACTGRPILFYMHDLDEYESDLRGFYFDPRTELPGPILDNQNALVDAIENINTHTELNIPQYEKFQQKFLAWDDGQAAKTISERVFNLESNTIDQQEHEQRRLEKTEAAKIELLRSNSFWSTSNFEFDVSMVLLLENNSGAFLRNLANYLEQTGVVIQIVAVVDYKLPASSKISSLLKSNKLKIVTAKKSSSIHQRIKSALSAVDGKFVKFHSPDMRLRPDALKLLVTQANNHLSPLVLKDLGDPDLQSGDAHTLKEMAESRYFQRSKLDDKLILTDYLKSQFPIIDTGISAQRFIDGILMSNAPFAAITTLVQPTTEGSSKTLSDVEADAYLALDLLQSIDTTAQLAHEAVFRDAIEKLAREIQNASSANKRRKLIILSQALVCAYPSQGEPPITNAVTKSLIEDVSEVEQSVAIERVESKLTTLKNDVVSPPKNLRSAEIKSHPKFGTKPRLDTFFVELDAGGMNTKIEKMLGALLVQSHQYLVIISGPNPIDVSGINSTVKAQVRTCKTNSVSYWYWLERSAWLFVDGFTPENFKTVLKQSKKFVIQTGYQSLNGVSRAPAHYLNNALCRNDTEFKKEANIWTHVLASEQTYRSTQKLPIFRNIVLHPVSYFGVEDGTSPYSFSAPVSAVRIKNGIQSNQKLVVLLQQLDHFGEVELLIDKNHLKTLLPPKCKLIALTIDGSSDSTLTDLLRACDVLITPIHPILFELSCVDKPVVLVNSSITTIKKSLTDKIQLFEDHELIGNAVEKIFNGTASNSINPFSKSNALSMNSKTSLQAVFEKIFKKLR